jgi:hypothetical protein
MIGCDLQGCSEITECLSTMMTQLADRVVWSVTHSIAGCWSVAAAAWNVNEGMSLPARQVSVPFNLVYVQVMAMAFGLRLVRHFFLSFFLSQVTALSIWEPGASNNEHRCMHDWRDMEES